VFGRAVARDGMARVGLAPVAGSFHNTRSGLRAASAVPPATTTMPECCENPVPPPPPWCGDTFVAPLAVFSSGWSLTASGPWHIASICWFGLAAEPETRRSRPIRIGEFSAPLATLSLNISRTPCRTPRDVAVGIASVDGFQTV